LFDTVDVASHGESPNTTLLGVALVQEVDFKYQLVSQQSSKSQHSCCFNSYPKSIQIVCAVCTFL